MTFSFKGIDLKNIIQPGNDRLSNVYVYDTTRPIYGKTTIYTNSKPLKTNFMVNNIDLLSNVEARYVVPESDVAIPTGVKGVRYVLRGGGGGGGGGAGGARSNWAGDAWTNGGSGGNGGNGEYIYGQANVSGSNITISIGNGGGPGNGGGADENSYHSASSKGGSPGGNGYDTNIKIGNAQKITASGGQGGGPANGVNAGRNDAGGSDGSAGASRTEYDNNISEKWDNTHVKNKGNGGSGGSSGSGGGNNGSAGGGGSGNYGRKGGVQIIWLYGSDDSELPPIYVGYELVQGSMVGGYGNVFTGGQYVKSDGYCLVLEKNGSLRLIEGNSPIGENIVWSFESGRPDGTVTAQWDPTRRAFTIVYNGQVIWDKPRLPAYTTVGFGGSLICQGGIVSLRSDGNANVWQAP